MIDIKEIKSKILIYAMTGKLSKQLASDTSYYTLLKRLIKDNKKINFNIDNIKKRDNKYFYLDNDKKIDLSDFIADSELPSSWIVARLDCIASFGMGQTILKKNMSSGGEVPVYSATADDKPLGYIQSINNTIKLSKGDIVIPARGTIGDVTYVKDNEASCTQTTIWMKLMDKNISKFVYYYLKAYKDFIFSYVGCAIPQITIGMLSKKFIALPPIEEQERIVLRIEELFAIIDKLEQDQIDVEKYKQLTKEKIFDLAIKGLLLKQHITNNNLEEISKNSIDKKLIIKNNSVEFNIPESWKWAKISSICSKIVDGDHNPPKGVKHKTDYLMLSSTNINNNCICNLSQCRYLEKETFDMENKRTQLQVGDILLTTVGTLGRSCVFDGGLNICFQRSVSILTPLINPYYLKIYFDSSYFQNKMISEASGTAQKGFYLKQLSNCFVPVPPLEEQKEIVKKVQEYFTLLDILD